MLAGSLAAVLLAVTPGATLAAPRATAAEPTVDDALDLVVGQLSYGSTDAGVIEPDVRTLPWTTLRRLALESGRFLPPYQPVTAAELTRLLLDGARQDDFAGRDDDERQLLAYWLAYLGSGAAGLQWHGCDCKENPPNLRLSGRAVVTSDPLGAAQIGEAGWDVARGLSAAIEPVAEFWSGRWWAGVSARVAGRIVTAGRTTPEPLLYDDWPIPTGRPPTGTARESHGAWVVDWPRGVAGVRLGNWSLTAGWAARQVGPGLDGGLTLATNAPSFPAVTLRRTAPFTWSGLFGLIDPKQLLVRVGRLSEQTVHWQDEYGQHQRRDEPWFFQWLLTWNHTSWLRTTVTHSAIAVPRDGSLWGDIFQINFPLLSATWAEADRGPVTDRIVSLQFEARFRHAPWPLLPSSAGRIYWEYGGEDFNPSSVIPALPQISAPASVIGLELLSPRWDLVGEYAELRHPTVLWYSNTGFTDGYAHHGWVIGHPVGGAGESFTLLVRWRPPATAWELELGGRRTAWAMPGRLVNEASHWLAFGRWRRTWGRLRWELGADWWREEVWPTSQPDSRTSEDRVALSFGTSF